MNVSNKRAGAGIIPKLAKGIVSELPKVKGISERNLKRMLRFYREYTTTEVNDEKVPQAVAQLPWSHNALLKEKVTDIAVRFWYAEQVIIQGWSRDASTG